MSLPPPIRFGDHPALDFVNTKARPSGAETEWIPDGERLCDWLAQTGALPQAVIRALQARAEPGAVDAVAARARAFRTWLRSFVERHAGAKLSPAAAREMGPLNEVLRASAIYRQVIAAPAGAGHALTLGVGTELSEPCQLLWPIADAAADLVCHTDFGLVRRCEGPGCTVLFLDRTKNHARRFCSVAGCGNRAKQAAHRTRTRAASA